MINRIGSSLSGFKTLNDLKSGLNILLVEKTAGATSRQTRNRAGKSSLIEIVHFLLGASATPQSIFRSPALKEDFFEMDFALASEQVTVKRRGEEHGSFLVEYPDKSEKKYSTTQWRNLLNEKMFGLSVPKKDEYEPPSFRSLFSYFARREADGGFLSPERFNKIQNPGDLQTALMFLIGVDWHIARDWQTLRDKEKLSETLKKAVKTGGFDSIIGTTAELRTQLSLQENRLDKLRAEIDKFQVLPEYRLLEEESNSLTRKLNDLANANTIDRASLDELRKALASELPPDHTNLKAVYQQAGVLLPDLVKNRYEDVKKFHNSVIRNRERYLSDELEETQRRIERREEEKANLDQRRSKVMDILKTHGALDQFSKLQSEMAKLEADVKSLRNRFKATEDLESTKSTLTLERSRLENRLRTNFSEQATRLSEAIVAFEETSKQLYESAGSMTINVTKNGPDFKFPMQGSRSKGIRNMQIFCFDMMLMRLCTKRKIGPGFLIHDSHLFDGVDGRQVVSALRHGAEISAELDFQYIVTMNDDDAFKEYQDDFDLKDYVLPLRLTDATADGGLFGQRF